MNNMRRGFTLIELIFVIVIIGILAAVALPRFLETADASHVAKIKAYAGTLSRTTLPPFWNKSMEDNTTTREGKIGDYDANITASLKPPQELLEGTNTVSFAVGKLELVTFQFVGAPNNLTTSAVGTTKVGTTEYTLSCRDGGMTESPKCNVWDGSKWIVKY